jgi:hypothetical protein
MAEALDKALPAPAKKPRGEGLGGQLTPLDEREKTTAVIASGNPRASWPMVRWRGFGMDEELPLKVALGATAKLEVKTEVPSDASGRLGHAVRDTVSPITEWLGMMGDRMRIHRKIVIKKVLRRASALEESGSIH